MPGLALIRQLQARAANGSRILLTGPSSVDGDSVGGCLALAMILRQLTPSVQTAVTGDCPPRYQWMEGAEQMLDEAQLSATIEQDGAFDTLVILDGDCHRLCPLVAKLFAADTYTVIIDHHVSTQPAEYDAAWVDPSAESTTAMLYHLHQALGLSLNKTLATHLYVGLIFDTGGFRHSNTTPGTHEIAADLLRAGVNHSKVTSVVLFEKSEAGASALGHILANLQTYECKHSDALFALGIVPLTLTKSLRLGPDDLEGVVETLVSIRRVERAALLIERPDGFVKVSLRSRGALNVADVAVHMCPTGGGHAKAAGAYFPSSMADARDKLLPAMT